MRMTAGPFPVAALLPVVLAEREGLAGFLSLLTSLVVVLLAAGLWLATRRRWPRVGTGVLLAALLLLVGAWAPPPALASHRHVEGFMEGEAWIPVVAPADAPVWTDRGEARLEGEASNRSLHLDCPERCRFRLGAEPAWGAGPSATLVLDPDLAVDLRGGPLHLRAVHSVCERLPVVLALMRGGHPCAPCQATELLAGAGADGPRRIRPSPSPVC